MLNRRKKEFIKYYVLSKNATASAKRAGYSERTAYSTGSRLTKNVEVRREIEREFREIDESLKWSIDKIKQEITKLANEGKKESNRVRALELLAKIEGLYKEQGNSIAIFNGLEEQEQAIVKSRLT